LLVPYFYMMVQRMREKIKDETENT